MDPSSFHSQFIGFKAVIGNGEQSLKVDLKKKVHQEIRSRKFRRAKTPVLTDHDFASDIELLHVVCWALNGSYSNFEQFVLFLSNPYLFWFHDLKKYVCNIVARPVELATWVNEDLWRIFFSLNIIDQQSLSCLAFYSLHLNSIYKESLFATYKQLTCNSFDWFFFLRNSIRWS